MAQTSTTKLSVKLKDIYRVLRIAYDAKESMSIMPNDIEYTHTGLTIRGIGEIPHSNPRLAFAKVLYLFKPKLGRGFTGDNVKIGLYCTIGGNGFGYVWDGQHQWPMPHLGSVNIMDNVTIHNHVNIDRGVIGDTVINKGVKIDSFVHIAHGAIIGEHTLIASHAVIGGSVRIGSSCFIGIGANIKQKVKIGDNCIIGAGAVVINDVPSGWVVAGNPAKQIRLTK